MGTVRSHTKQNLTLTIWAVSFWFFGDSIDAVNVRKKEKNIKIKCKNSAKLWTGISTKWKAESELFREMGEARLMDYLARLNILQNMYCYQAPCHPRRTAFSSWGLLYHESFHTSAFPCGPRTTCRGRTPSSSQELRCEIWWKLISPGSSMCWVCVARFW